MVRPPKSVNPGPLGEPERGGSTSRSFAKGRYGTTGQRDTRDGIEPPVPAEAPRSAKYTGRATATPPSRDVDPPPVRDPEHTPPEPEPDDPGIGFTIDLAAAEEAEPARDTIYRRRRANLPRLWIEPVDREEEPTEPSLRSLLLPARRPRR
jgi:hypothetical protein